ncbi:hypothetical protein [Halopseudomonas pelagia]|uniref:hypothetical protein n=1 Tax=Halopseudomonas pelagia TaxID=553151 RepID=UPI0030DB977E|tara:strand:- start:169 stop:633 length:465 start_codon:yes stop_codon:yes gene_type:complete
MPLGIALFLIWLVLLLRFPRIMLPFSGVFAALALLLAGAFGVHKWYAGNLVGQLETRIIYTPNNCEFGKPLRVIIDNKGERTASQISWQLMATAPNYNTNLLDISITDATYQIDQPIAPGQQWQGCYAVPPLRSGARAPDLDYRMDRIRADFNN